jgi:hypothetical protein
MEGARDGLDYLASAGEDWIHLSVRPKSVPFNNIPTTRGRCQIAKCNAGFLVGPLMDVI